MMNPEKKLNTIKSIGRSCGLSCLNMEKVSFRFAYESDEVWLSICTEISVLLEKLYLIESIEQIIKQFWA